MVYKFNRQILLAEISKFYRSTLNAVLSNKVAKDIDRFFSFIENDPNWQTLEQINNFIIQVGWETAWKFAPIQEIRSNRKDKVKELQDRYWYTGFYGRGYLQITWRKNYETLSKLVDIDLVKNPDLLIKDASISYRCAALGFQEGLFTGKKISDYINRHSVDYYNARRVVNGLDKAKQIEKYCLYFIHVLNASVENAVIPVVPSEVNFPVKVPADLKIIDPVVPVQTVEVTKVVERAAKGWSTWKTTLTGILSSLGISSTAIFAVAEKYITDPFMMKALVILIISSIIIAACFALVYILIRIVMKAKEQERAHQLTLEQMRIAADPDRTNVRII